MAVPLWVELAGCGCPAPAATVITVTDNGIVAAVMPAEWRGRGTQPPQDGGKGTQPPDRPQTAAASGAREAGEA